jgi:hypothetical protein
LIETPCTSREPKSLISIEFLMDHISSVRLEQVSWQSYPNRRDDNQRRCSIVVSIHGIVTVIWFDGMLSTPPESTDFTT